MRHVRLAILSLTHCSRTPGSSSNSNVFIGVRHFASPSAQSRAHTMRQAEQLSRDAHFPLQQASTNSLAFCHVPLVWLNHLDKQNSRLRNGESLDEEAYADDKTHGRHTSGFDQTQQLTLDSLKESFINYRQTLTSMLNEDRLTSNDASALVCRLNALNYYSGERAQEIFPAEFLFSVAVYALERLGLLHYQSYEILIYTFTKMSSRNPASFNGPQFGKIKHHLLFSLPWYYSTMTRRPLHQQSPKKVLAFCRTIRFLTHDLDIDFRCQSLHHSMAQQILEKLHKDYSYFCYNKTASLLEKYYYTTECSTVFLDFDAEFWSRSNVDPYLFAKMLVDKLVRIFGELELRDNVTCLKCLTNFCRINLKYERWLTAYHRRKFVQLCPTFIVPKIERSLRLMDTVDKRLLIEELVKKIEQRKTASVTDHGTTGDFSSNSSDHDVEQAGWGRNKINTELLRNLLNIVMKE